MPTQDEKDPKARHTPENDKERVNELLHPEETADAMVEDVEEATRQSRAGHGRDTVPPETPGTQPIPGIHSVGTPAATAPSRIATEKRVEGNRDQVIEDEEESRKDLAKAAKTLP